MHAGTDREPPRRKTVAFDRHERGTPRRDRSLGVVLARDDRDEEGHDAVTEELVDDAAVVVDGPRRRAVVRLEESPGSPLPTERSASPVEPRTSAKRMLISIFGAAGALRERAEAGLAEERVAGHRPVPEQASQGPADAVEWGTADLAARGRRQAAPEAPGPSQGGVLAGQEGPPLLRLRDPRRSRGVLAGGSAELLEQRRHVVLVPVLHHALAAHPEEMRISPIA